MFGVRVIRVDRMYSTGVCTWDYRKRSSAWSEVLDLLDVNPVPYVRFV